MASAGHIPVSACREGGLLLVKPQGACSVAICGGLKALLADLKRPEITDIYMDLSESAGLDSTFIGCLLSLATRKSEPNAPTLHLVAPSPAASEALRRMHVLPLFDVCPFPPATSNTWMMLSLDKIGPAGTADVVIEAHERLIEADPRNAPSCQPVVEGFRAEREGKKSDE